jgi:hypothetical protein
MYGLNFPVLRPGASLIRGSVRGHCVVPIDWRQRSCRNFARRLGTEVITLIVLSCFM